MTPNANTSIRIPHKLRSHIDAFLSVMNVKAGITMTRSEFFVRSAEFYLKDLLNCKNEKEISERLAKEKGEFYSRSSRPVHPVQIPENEIDLPLEESKDETN